MFIENKYLNAYYKIINNAKSRNLSELTIYEKHHIIPKSLGGSNDLTNLVILTLREHFICHKLLTKCLVGKAKTKMIYAYWILSHTVSIKDKTIKITSRNYEYIRKLMSHSRTSADFTPEWKEKISLSKKGKSTGENNPMYGKNHTEKSKLKLSASRKAKSGTVGWNVRPPCSTEKAEKIKKANIGKKWVHNKTTKERKYIDPSKVVYYVELGWELGLGPKS